MDGLIKKQNLINNTLRHITNIANAADELTRNMLMFVDNGYNSAGADPITDEILEVYGLTYAEFAKSKEFSDEIIACLDANGREMAKILSKLRNVVGK